MKARKGDVILSWVLLVGFVVGLATMVTMWVKNTAEQSTQLQIDKSEQEVRCSETALNAAMDCQNAPHDLKITNTGKFTLQKIKIRQQDTNQDISQIISPQQTETLNINLDPTLGIEIIPIIKINEKEVICATRKITYTC